MLNDFNSYDTNRDRSLFEGTARVGIPQLATKPKVIFETFDPIFDLEAPHIYCLDSQKPSKSDKHLCHVCQSDKHKQWKLCEFCALWGCEKCVYKQLQFPKADRDSKPGTICFVCITKIHINSVSLFWRANSRMQITKQTVDQLK